MSCVNCTYKLYILQEVIAEGERDVEGERECGTKCKGHPAWWFTRHDSRTVWILFVCEHFFYISLDDNQKNFDTKRFSIYSVCLFMSHANYFFAHVLFLMLHIRFITQWSWKIEEKSKLSHKKVNAIINFYYQLK